MQETLYTPEEVAEKLKTTRRTVYRWIEDNKLKALKAGKMWRIPQSALDEFLQNQGE